MVGITFSQIVFSDGTAVDLRPGDILVLTGPNSGGKSNALRTLAQRLVFRDNTTERDTIKSTRTERSGTFEEFLEKVGTRAQVTRHANGNYQLNSPRIGNWTLSPTWWTGEDFHENFNDFFQTLLTTRQRFNIVDPVSVANFRDASSALQKLRFDEPVECIIGELTRKSFGVEIYTHLDGGTLSLKVGQRSSFPTREDYRSPSEQQKAQALSNLVEEGDGIQSFTAVAMAALVDPKSVTLINEAEAFLHPPQAKRLAQGLVSKMPITGQLIIATHDYDFLRALVTSGGDRVHVVRIRRTPKTLTKYLSNAKLKELWSDPLLFTSDVISALFHDVAVLCEGETDVRFLRAITDALEDQLGDDVPDIRFFSCGSKAKIDKIASALEAIGVPTVAVTDCDVLNDKSLVERILASLAITVTNFDSNYQILANAVNAARTKKSAAALAADLQLQLNAIDQMSALQKGQPLKSEKKNVLRAIIDDPSQWSDVKKNGRIAVLGLGQSVITAFDLLIEESAKGGFLINTKGELESFWPEGPRSDKQRWLVEALSKDLLRDPALESARDFVRTIVSTARKQRSRISQQILS